MSKGLVVPPKRNMLRGERSRCQPRGSNQQAHSEAPSPPEPARPRELPVGNRRSEASSWVKVRRGPEVAIRGPRPRPGQVARILAHGHPGGPREGGARRPPRGPHPHPGLSIPRPASGSGKTPRFSLTADFRRSAPLRATITSSVNLASLKQPLPNGPRGDGETEARPDRGEQPPRGA